MFFVVSYAAVFRLVTQRFTLGNEPKNGCVGDYVLWGLDVEQYLISLQKYFDCALCFSILTLLRAD